MEIVTSSAASWIFTWPCALGTLQHTVHTYSLHMLPRRPRPRPVLFWFGDFLHSVLFISGRGLRYAISPLLLSQLSSSCIGTSSDPDLFLALMLDPYPLSQLLFIYHRDGYRLCLRC